jgi:hypothetical protein
MYTISYADRSQEYLLVVSELASVCLQLDDSYLELELIFPQVGSSIVYACAPGLMVRQIVSIDSFL